MNIEFKVGSKVVRDGLRWALMLAMTFSVGCLWYTDPPTQEECEIDEDCIETGCSGQLCADDEVITTCEWSDEYACFGSPYTSCGCSGGVCGWEQTVALQSCLAEPLCTPGETRPAEDGCNNCICMNDGNWACTEMACPSSEECKIDEDCLVTGCSGQICAAEEVVTTCEWLEEYSCYGAPFTSCGCHQGLCGWDQTAELEECLGALE